MKPCDYLGHLLGHEGEGSLLTLLRHKRWATGVSAGDHGLGYSSSSCCTMFCVTFNLTKVLTQKVIYYGSALIFLGIVYL